MLVAKKIGEKKMEPITVITADGTQFSVRVLEKIEAGFSVEVACPSSSLKISIPVVAENLDVWPAMTTEQLDNDTDSMDEDDKEDYMKHGPGAEASSICIKSGEGGYIVSPNGLSQED